jgi:hypothetical protein
VEKHKLLNHENKVIRAGAEKEYQKYLKMDEKVAGTTLMVTRRL